MNSKTVVLSTARTPFGRLGGALASLEATTLGGRGDPDRRVARGDRSRATSST